MTENTHISLLALLNQAYFWDVNIADLDVERNSAYIIRRVFELGDIDEIRAYTRLVRDRTLSGGTLDR